MKKEKCVVLLSGGLDSRLAVKIMQERDYEVLAVFFRLPFGTGCCNESCSFNFSQIEGVDLRVFDCTKEELFEEYLDLVRRPKYKRGSGMNPCVDCRIFLFKKAKEFADKEGIKWVVTGEVLGQRPMSQMKTSMEIIEEESGLKGRIIRPLCEMGILGRRREKQIALAKKFKITYPNSGGGCLLCEKEYTKKLKGILDKKINYHDIQLLGIGRHFENSEIILGKNKDENRLLENEMGIKIIPKQPGPTALIKNKKYLGKLEERLIKKAKELIQKYSKNKIVDFEIIN